MTKERALDIFGLLGRLDKKRHDIWENLSEVERKGFAPVVVMRWMSGTTSPLQIILINTLVNPVLFSLGKHPQLLMDLLAASSDGHSKRYNWKSIKSTKSKKSDKLVELIKEYHGYSERIAKQYISFFSKEDYIEMAEKLGYQDADIKELKKELK
jgi:hypothetical protein